MTNRPRHLQNSLQFFSLDVILLSNDPLGRILSNTQYPLFAVWQGRMAGPPIWQSNAWQRLWILTTQYQSTSDWDELAYYWVSESVRSRKAQRYISMRGST